MRLKYTFEIMELEDQMVAVPVGEGASEFHGVIKMNETVGAILELLKIDIDEAEIINVLGNRYEVSQEILRKDVHNTLEKFKEEGLLV